MRTLAAVAALALLAACSGEEADPQAPTGQASEAPAEPGPAPVVSAAPLTEIPARFVGLWDYVDGKCLVYSDAQLTIEPRRLEFYESVGEVTAVRQPDADTIVVSLAMSGEGDTWTEESTYRLLEGGAVLESSFTDPEGEPFRRKRCEAFVDGPVG